MLELCWAEETICQLASCGNSYWGQFHATTHIAQSENIRYTSVLIFINLDVSTRCESHADIFQADLACVGVATNGPKKTVIAFVFLMIPHRQRERLIRCPLDLSHVALAMDLDSHFHHFIVYRLVDDWIETSQNVILTNEEINLRAQLTENTGKLYGNVASANNGHSARLFLEVKEAITGDPERGTGNLGNNRVSTGRNENVICVILLVVHKYTVGSDKTCMSSYQINTFSFESTLLVGTETFDVGVASLHKGRPVEGPLGNVEGIARSRGMEKARCLCSVPHDLFGNTAQVHAGATHSGGFDDGSAGAVRGRTGGGSHATAACT
mmetsp:Transcript_3489/g.8387  ORF Transcript_3489/g.8387 Transcript_3489/m.8387 type:complete len:325 (+) Transcript_3489:275-1249(+)